jgi:uncharacterized protein (DUF488 family)
VLLIGMRRCHNPPAMKRITTIGYEGLTLAEFTRLLKEADVRLLLDVRELPLSRRAGFSKRSLAAAMERAGIKYQHDRRLGAPKPIRTALRETGDWKTYFAHFEAYLDTQREVIKEHAETRNACIALLCYERDPKQCHRSVVARHLQEVCGATIKHLGAADVDRPAPGAGVRPRKGVPAAK